MLSLARIEQICAETFKKAGYNFNDFGIKVSINNRLTRTLGRCISRTINGVATPEAIEFSKLLLESAADSSVVDVIKHECAHALVAIETGTAHGHDIVFKQMCHKVGTFNDGRVNETLERTVDESQIFKYFVICKECGKIVGKYHRAGKVVQNVNGYSCGACRGKLKVVTNF